MIRFNNDYNRTGHPAVLAALAATMEESYEGYGIDPCCERATELIKAHLNCPEAQVHYVIGGTQANYIGISFLLRPWEGVLCADTGHINVHETGAPEHVGHKCLTMPNTNGKISAEQIKEQLDIFEIGGIQEHVVVPKMVYLSQPTEVGTVYSLAELEAISAVCKENGLYLFIDGARMGYGLAAEGADFTLADIARVSDMFYIGGTKCGALFGEAVVITNPAVQSNYRNAMKQNGAMLAKGWLLGAQFAALFTDNLYFKITESAIAKALRIRDAFTAIGVEQFVESPTNQQFFILSDAQMAALETNFTFMFDHIIEPNRNMCRFCTSWASTDEEIDALCAAIAQLPC